MARFTARECAPPADGCRAGPNQGLRNRPGEGGRRSGELAWNGHSHRMLCSCNLL